MATINLRNFYPLYIHDEFVEVPDEIAGELSADRKYQKTHDRVVRRYKIYSLDADDGIESAANFHTTDNPEVILDMVEKHCGLCRALNSLPETQGRKIEARFILGMTQKEISKKDGVSEEGVSKAIEKGQIAMKKYFNQFC